MDEYSCPRCGYITSSSQCYKKHLQRKYICKAIKSNLLLDDEYHKHIEYMKNKKKKAKEFKCDECNKVLSSKQMLQKHKNKCASKNNMNDSELLKHMNEQIQELKKKIENVPTTTNVTNNITNNNNNNNNVSIENATINLISYHETNENKLSSNEILTCMLHNNNCVPLLIKTTHCNENYPEHMNIYMEHYDDKFVKIYDGEQWIIIKKEDLIDDLINKKSFFIFEQVKEWKKNKEHKQEVKRFEKYIHATEDTHCIDNIKDNVVETLYNNRKKILKHTTHPIE